MNVHVALYAGLFRYLPPPGRRTGKGRLNGKQAPPDTVRREGDTLAIFPPLAGGGPTRAAAASDPAPWERRT